MPLKTSIDEQPTLNLTPMLDVVFLLIIFFMVGTQFSTLERKIELQVPQVTNTTALTAAPAKKVINVYADGQITLDRQEVTVEQLISHLTAARQQYADLGVLIRGDAASSHQSVAEVLSACQQAGVNDLGISVKPTETARK